MSFIARVIIIGICLWILVPVAVTTQTNPAGVDQAVIDATEKTSTVFPKLIEEAATDISYNSIYKAIDDFFGK
jgi:hypothetical protein